MTTFADTERLAALLHDEWDARVGEPSEPGVPCPDCADSAARLIAQGVRVGDDGLHSDGDVCTGLTCGNPEHGWSTR